MAKSLFFIVPSEPEGNIQVWAYAAQSEANLNQAVFRVMVPAPGDPPGHQEKVVRRALADGASALIVVPGDSPELAQALTETEAKKVPIVLLGKGLSAPAGSRPFTVVNHEPFEKSARKIVATTIEDLKKIGRPAEGTALVVANQQTDMASADRVAALKEAATSMGFAPVVTVSIDGTDRAKAKAAVVEAVKLNPSIAIAIADSDESLLAAANARFESQGAPAFFVGGYVGYSTVTTGFPFRMESCEVDGKYQFLARLAVRTILSRLRGESVPEFVGQEPIFTRNKAKAWEEGDSYTSFPGQPKKMPRVVSPGNPPETGTPPAESKPQ